MLVGVVLLDASKCFWQILLNISSLKNSYQNQSLKLNKIKNGRK
jgi:hypothetical protein